MTYWSGIPKRTVHVRDSSVREIDIIRLEYLTEYKVEVVAYTDAGDGPESANVSVTTDESSKNLYICFK